MNYRYFKKKFKNQNILITGHTGFKGSYLSTFLNYLGSNLIGISDKEFKNYADLKLKINSKIFDLNNKKKIKNNINNFKPKYIFHLAAQSIVYKAIKNPSLTWNSNLVSTINLLTCAKKIKSVKYIIVITTDKVYKNDNKSRHKNENDYLMGDDSYSMSKVGIENYIKHFSKKNKNIKVITIRAGNVLGGGDWSEKRLVPDIVRSVIKKRKLKLRSANSVRPWIHVLDCIHGYLYLASRMNEKVIKNGSSWNISNVGKKSYTTSDIIKNFKKKFKFKTIKEKNTFIEKKILMLDAKKIKKKLGWEPLYRFKKCINLTIDWYHEYIYKKKNLTKQHIKNYLNERI